MKLSVLCLFLMLSAVLSQIDYNTQTSFDTATCRSTTGRLLSPIIIENSICGAYGSFNLVMQNTGSLTPTFNATFGAYQVSYGGAKLTYNGTEYTSTNILFRVGSENVLAQFRDQSDGELQILMAAADGSLAVFSLFIKTVGSDLGYQAAKTANPVITSLISSNWDISLETIGAQINDRPANDLLLNVFRYEGTQTFPPCNAAVWYLYAGQFFVQDLTDITNAMNGQPVVLRSGQNTRTTTSTPVNFGGGGGPITIERLCFSGFFENHMGDNYGLWFGIIIILIFFFITLCTSDNPITDPDYQESCKTIHPIYSICVISNDIHTRKSRASLILMTVTIHALFSSAWYRRSYPTLKGSDIIVYAIYSMLISWAFVYILGNILRGYYVAKYHYCKTKDESWDQKAQNRIFAFYAAVFATIVVAWPFTVWNMGEIHPERSAETSNYWVATFFVGLGLEFLVFDIIVALLAKPSQLVRNFIRRKGYMYDNLCHETYMNYIKMD